MTSDNATGADNQQGSPLNILRYVHDPSETTRRAPFSRQEIETYLQGALHDASLNKKRRYRFTQKGTEWLHVLQELFKKLNYNSWVYREGSDRDVYVLETLADFLDFDFDPSGIKTKQEQISYIRGFFDAEGGIPQKRENRFYIQLVQKDQVKMKKLKYILSNLGIHTGVIHNPSWRVDPDYWRMFVATKSNQTFAELVNSWHPRKQRIFRERMVI